MEEIQEIEINKIHLNKDNPRKEFDKDRLKELSDSINKIGQINPIQVKKIKDKDEYELICGERRLKAHQLANKKTIKAIVKKYSSKEDEMIESLIENLHRADLNSIEKENYITSLWKTGKYKTYIQLAKEVGLSGTHLVNILEAKKIREQIKIDSISTRDIRETNLIKNIEDKKRILQRVEKGKINSNNIRNVSNIIKKSPIDVKQAYFSDKISIEQAEKISKIDNEKLREKMILAHKNIRNIDKSIERDVEKNKPKSETQVIKTRQVIENFRNNAIETQKTMQKTIRSLMMVIPYIELMDESQLEKLAHFQDMLEINLSNALELSENLKDKISN